MSKNDMVMVPRDLLERVDFGKDTKVALAALPELRAILGEPAEQHQGEPVALPERYVHEHHGCFLSERQHGWNACLDEIAKLGPLYSRPVQGEPVGYVCGSALDAALNGRIGAESIAIRKEPSLYINKPLYAHADQSEIRTTRQALESLKSEANDLRTQLAEAHELLREVHVGMWPSNPLTIKIGSHLSASAEPSAPVCETCDNHGAVGNILNAEPCPDCSYSAPVEIDEAEVLRRVSTSGDKPNISLADMKARYAPVEIDERAALERALLGQTSFKMNTANVDIAWWAWRARADLERKS